MPNETVSVSIARDVFGAAERVAALDHVDVATLLETLIKRHVDDVEVFTGANDSIPVFSLDDYEMQRDEGETDGEYEARLSLFK